MNGTKIIIISIFKSIPECFIMSYPLTKIIKYFKIATQNKWE